MQTLGTTNPKRLWMVPPAAPSQSGPPEQRSANLCTKLRVDDSRKSNKATVHALEHHLKTSKFGTMILQMRMDGKSLFWWGDQAGAGPVW